MTTEKQTQGHSLSGKASCMSQSSPSRVKKPANFSSSHTQPPSTSIDFNQVLQEVQASVMESIPSLDVSEFRVNNSASQHTARLASKSEQNTPLNLTLQAPASVSQLPAAAVDLQSSAGLSATSSASPGAECSSRPQVEKPRRSSLDKEMKHSPDRAGKSPPLPPPPPRRIHAVTSVLTTGRSGEVVFVTRKEPVGAQSAQDEADKEKELSLVPQLKPPRQPPEVKHKPQMFTAAPLAISTSAPAAVSAQRQEEEEEEEEKFLKELQTSSSTSSSSALRSHAKSHRASGSPENTPKGQQQITQKQASQPRLVSTPR